MGYLESLKREMRLENRGQGNIRPYLLYLGYREHYDDEAGLARACAAASLFQNHKKKVFRSDLIAGSAFGLLAGEYDLPDALLDRAVECLKKAKELHLQVESMYVPNMNFTGINRLLEETIRELTQEANSHK